MFLGMVIGVTDDTLSIEGVKPTNGTMYLHELAVYSGYAEGPDSLAVVG